LGGGPWRMRRGLTSISESGLLNANGLESGAVVESGDAGAGLPAALIVSPTLLEIGFGPGLGAGASAARQARSRNWDTELSSQQLVRILKRLPQAHVRRTAMIAKTREKNIKSSI